MSQTEIESFISKFMGLLRSGRNATLNIQSEAGKALINLSVEVKQSSQQNSNSRNGPARQRRRERRAAARDVAVAQEEVKVVSEQDKEDSAKAAAEKQLSFENKEASANGGAKVIITEPEDEIENISISESKKVQARPNEICATLSVIPIRHLNANDDHLGKSIAAKVEAKKVKVRDVFINRSPQGAFIRCDILIEPLNGKLLEEIDFEFENCHVVPFYGFRIT